MQKCGLGSEVELYLCKFMFKANVLNNNFLEVIKLIKLYNLLILFLKITFEFDFFGIGGLQLIIFERNTLANINAVYEFVFFCN